MKFLVIMKMGARGTTHGPEVMEEIAAASKAWVQEQVRNGRVESPYLFAEGGGCMTVNADSIAELQEIIYANPGSANLTHEVHVLVDFEPSVDRLARNLRSSLERSFRTGAAAPAAGPSTPSPAGPLVGPMPGSGG
jgi:hypothetical protein